jgi:hypothetical protein
MGPATRVIAAAAAILLMAPAAYAGPSVFLNGVNIDGVTNQKIERANITIDAQGNVHIEAKDYAVQASTTPTKPNMPPTVAGVGLPVAAPQISKRYFLVTEQSERGAAQFDIAVFINSKWIRELKSEDDQIVTEITKHLKPGPNKIVLAATKRTDGARRSTAASTYYRVIIGEGNAGGDNIMIDNPLIEMKRTAAETGNVTEEFTISAR